MSDYECRIYVGNLPMGTRSQDIIDLFQWYGKIVYIDFLKKINKQGHVMVSHDSVFAFVKFEDARAAANAAYSRDGYYYHGYRLVVEKWTSEDSKFRVQVTGLPPFSSWQVSCY